MKDPTKKLKRKKKVEARRKSIHDKITSKNFIMFGKQILRVKPPVKKDDKEKKVKPIPAYRVVILTARMDKLTSQIKEMGAGDKRLVGLKHKRDIIKKKLIIK